MLEIQHSRSVAEEFLVLGQKFSVAKTKSVLICAICGYFCAFESLWPILSFARYSSTPKVKKCKKSVQNRLIFAHFWLISVNFLSIYVKKAPKSAHFYPHFYAKNKYVL
jgi:hypothetical protein